MSRTASSLVTLTATTSHLALIIQNFHWHVTGPNFLTLHEFFAEEYKNHIEAVDELAERLRALGGYAPATLSELAQHSLVKDPSSALKANDMLAKLQDDYKLITTNLQAAIGIAQEEAEEAVADLMIERLGYYQKQVWIIASMLTN